MGGFLAEFSCPLTSCRRFSSSRFFSRASSSFVLPTGFFRAVGENPGQGEEGALATHARGLPLPLRTRQRRDPAVPVEAPTSTLRQATSSLERGFSAPPRLDEVGTHLNDPLKKTRVGSPGRWQLRVEKLPRQIQLAREEFKDKSIRRRKRASARAEQN